MSHPYTYIDDAGGTGPKDSSGSSAFQTTPRGKPEVIAARFAEQSRQEQLQQQLCQQQLPLYGDGSRVIPPALNRPKRIIRLPMNGLAVRKSKALNVQAQNRNHSNDI